MTFKVPQYKVCGLIAVLFCLVKSAAGACFWPGGTLLICKQFGFLHFICKKGFSGQTLFPRWCHWALKVFLLKRNIWYM